MKTKLSLILVVLLSGCAALPLLTSSAVTNGLQFGIKDPAQRKQVACQMTQAATALSTLATVPDQNAIASLLNQYVPASSTKALTVANMTAIYALVYPTIQKKAPADQLAIFKQYVDAINAGASPFCNAAP